MGVGKYFLKHKRKKDININHLQNKLLHWIHLKQIINRFFPSFFYTTHTKKNNEISDVPQLTMLSHSNNSNQANIVNKVNNGFTEAALAGLAAKEDFTSVVLKRSESSNSYAGEFLPFSDLMLIQIKGNYLHTNLLLVWYPWNFFCFERTSLLSTSTRRALYQLAQQHRLLYTDRSAAALSLRRRAC